MSAFTEKELAYLKEQKLGRLATIGPDGMPHLAPVSFRHNPELDAIDVGGMNNSQTKKFRDVRRRGVAAIVVDDVLPPWRPRGIEVRGEAHTSDEGGEAFGPRFEPSVIRIVPRRIVAWGIDSEDSRPNARDVERA